MNKFTRRTLLLGSVAGAAVMATIGRVFGQTNSLSDIGDTIVSSPEATIYTAREIVTLDPPWPMPLPW